MECPLQSNGNGLSTTRNQNAKLREFHFQVAVPASDRDIIG